MEKANEDKAIKMALIHDLAEARGGEKNLINKFYNKPLNETLIVREIAQDYRLTDFDLEKSFPRIFRRKK
jgi:5'-deoxynucleotidase YfbR-like HD superfamily hydrolase